MQYFKDRTECFDDYYSCIKKSKNNYNLSYAYNWIKLFIYLSLYDANSLIELVKNYKDNSKIWNYITIISLNNNNNKYILLVDDEKDILFLYREWLKSDGYKIVSFDNPVEALSYLNKNDNISNCSLVITDYKMPQMSGLDLIKKIREKDSNSNIKTMIVSAYVKDDLLRDNSYMKKLDQIIEKPVDRDMLKNEVTNLLNDKIL